MVVWYQCWGTSRCPSLALPAPSHVAGGAWLCLSHRDRRWKGESHLPAKSLSQAVGHLLPRPSVKSLAWPKWCTHTFSRASARPLCVASCISAGTTRLLAKGTALQEEEMSPQHPFLSSCAPAGSVSLALCRQGAPWATGCCRSRTSVNGFLGVLEG